MAVTIESLYSDFRSNYQDKWDYSIDFYNANVLFFNNIITFKNADALQMYIQITCRYVNALFSKGRYNECIEICDKNLYIIDNEILRLNADQLKDDWYLSVLFNKAKSYYYLKDFKSATSVLKALIAYDPNNELYNIWLKNSKYYQMNKYVNIGLIILPIVVIVDIILKNAIPRILMQSIFIVGFLILILMSAYNYYLERTVRKNEP